MEADQQRAVDVAGGQVVGGPASRRPATSGISRTSWRSRAASSELMPRSRRGKNGSLNSRPVGSVMTTRDRVAAPGDEAAGGPVGDVAELGRWPPGRRRRTSGLTLRRAVDDARDGRPGDAREMGDLFEGGAGAPGRDRWAGPRQLRLSVRALSRLLRRLAGVVKRALSRSFGRVSGAARRPVRRRTVLQPVSA